MTSDSATDELWLSYLKSYASGEHAELDVPGPQSANDSGSAEENSSESQPPSPPYLYANGITIDTATARRVREFYEEYRYLSPPRSPREIERRRCVNDYRLRSPVQLANIQNATALLASFFLGAVCTFSLFLDDSQYQVAASGPDDLIERLQLTVGTPVPPQIGLCSHAILQDKEIQFIPDLHDDWRFAGNPYAKAGIKSYIGSVVHLHPNPGHIPTQDSQSLHEDASSENVGIGVLNISFVHDYLEQLTPAQTKVVKEITSILQEQLRSTWQGNTYLRDSKARQVLADYLETSLVRRPLEKDLSILEQSRSQSGEGSISSSSENQRAYNFKIEAETAVEQLRSVLDEVDFIGIIDLSSFHSPQNGSGEYIINKDHKGEIQIVASYSRSKTIDLTLRMGHDAQLALRSMLNTHDRDLSSAFNQDGRLSGLEDMLSSTTAAHIAMPFFTGNDAMFLILITTETNGHRFYDGETDFARSIGSVLKASAVQSRVIAADYKRIKVMSRVSHEMRTPVHGVLSSVDMLEESIKRKEFDQAADLLTYLHTSARDLKRLMNRILDEESSLQLGRKSLQDLRLESPTSPIEGPTADPISAQNDESQNNDDMLPLSPSTLPTDTNNISDYWNRANINDVTTPLMTPVSTETDPLASIPLKVLIVEDNEISRKILIMSVKRLDKGISITEARDGVEGLTAFCQGQPDLVLTDVNMPVLDGIGSAKAMRTIELAQNWPRCQIFTVTGLGQADSKLKADALNGTVDGWLVKGQHRLQDIQAIVKNAQDTKRNRL